ncbi:MAG: GNAT family N-acetyltransferase [Bacilli bacterium]|nr:GNAT family N-acetyltransferase [Bacilli bacterium]
MKAIRTLLACIRKADQTYNLIQHGDKIVIGLSGGKDSIALTYCLSLYRKFSHTDFTIQPVVLDLGFPGFDPAPLIEFCKSLDLDLVVSDNTDVYKILTIQKEKQNTTHLPCSICSRMKKAAINKVAKDLGFNKVAFAHHADDAIETLFMNEIYGGRVATFSPKMHLEKADIEFIRPLINVRESDIKKLIKEENLPVVDSHCPADKTTTREDIKIELDSLYKRFPKAKESFLSMLSNFEHEDLWNDEIYYQIDQEGLCLKPIVNKLDAFAAYDIRHKVFVTEQNVPYELEVILDEEKEAHNYLITLGETPIGHVRYRFKDGKYKVERFCILKEYRGEGRGKKAFSYFLDFLGAKFNPCTICFDAQYYLKDFYESFGCESIGEPFMEAGIKHIYMEKKY